MSEGSSKLARLTRLNLKIVECKYQIQTDNPHSYLGLNLKIVECKCQRPLLLQNCRKSLNLKIVECKLSFFEINHSCK